ncbi:MAG: amidohydrolase family protein [Planctomycetaceae bacterium]
MADALADEPLTADVVLKGGTIIDGTGHLGVVGDVALRGDKIVGVGALALGRVDRIVDCSGLYVVPGFIDLHTHSDEQVVSVTMRGCVNYVLQGCTTSVTGNCGSGAVDVGKFYSRIDEAGAGTNVAHLIPQGSLRAQVMGVLDRRATEDERKTMRELTDQGLREGAWGMSTGLIYVPSVYADTEELIDLAKVVGAHGGLYASHIRGEGRELLAAVDEALRIGEAAACPVHISHFKASGSENWGLIRQAAAQIEAARAAGRRVTADQYPYTASSTSLEATLFPTWARSGGTKGLVERLDNPQIAPRVRADVQKAIEGTHDGADVVISRFQPMPHWIGKSVKQIAAEEAKSAVDLACEIVRLGEAGVVNFSMSEEDVRFAMQLPWIATASDGRSYLPGPERPHPRSYGTFARKIGRYAIAEHVISLEQAIRSASGLPADIIGLTDRGYLKPGYAADVVALDPAQYLDTATFDNPHQYATGVKYVFINGVPAVHAGVPTGALAGKALRRASPLGKSSP